MSHYCVGVIVEDIDNFEKEVENILAPYDEGLKVEPYIYKTKAELIARGKKYKEECCKLDKLNKLQKKYVEAETDEDFYNLERDDDELYDKDGNELTTYNPKSKWDWWEFGGRFYRRGYYIQIKDFKLRRETSEEICKLYKIAWESFKNKTELSKEIINKVFGGFRFWNDEYYLKRYGTCENWIKHDFSNIPYAFVDENGWYEKGSMGWWGCDDATKESIDKYIEFAENYFKDIKNQNKYIIFVDCHI